MRLGIVTTCVSRNAGGLFHSVRRLAQTTAAAGVGVEIFSVRDEWTEEDLPAWRPLVPRVFDRSGPARLAWAPELGKELLRFDPEDAVVHLHGLWQYASLATLRWRTKTGAPTVISPRGMLDPWALANSKWRKRAVGLLYEYRNLRSASLLHALNDSEYRSMRAFGLKQPIAILPNGVDIPSESELVSADPSPLPATWAGKRVLLFLARVHPKKGILPLLEAWKKIGAGRRDWRLALAGPDENGHAAEVSRALADLGLGDEVVLVGPQYGTAKRNWLLAADAFVLPSHSEGFPMAVLEAMAHRLAVIMTEECNFPEAFDAGVAFSARPKSASLAEALERLFSLADAERKEMGASARTFVESTYGWSTIAEQTIEAYRWLLAGGSAPSFVRTD